MWLYKCAHPLYLGLWLFSELTNHFQIHVKLEVRSGCAHLCNHYLFFYFDFPSQTCFCFYSSVKVTGKINGGKSFMVFIFGLFLFVSKT